MMAYRRVIYIFLLIFFLVGLSSCNLPLSTALPTSTLPSTPTITPVTTEPPATEVTILSSPTPEEAATATAITVDLNLPNGIATFSGTGSQVAYYDLQGQLLGEFQTPNLGSGPFQKAAVAGPLTFSPAPQLPPFVYYAFENGGELWLNTNNEASLLLATHNLLYMMGVPGESLIAYTLVEVADYGVNSRLYLGNLQTIPTANPILDTTSTQGYIIKPLAISVTDGQPVGVWYTSVPYGIGGDIVFEPRETLNFLNLSDNQIKTFLDVTIGPSSISDDQTWVAYTSSGGNSPLSIVYNFDLSAAITFPLKEDSDRGAGDAVFSPGNQYIAWREAGGSLAGGGTPFRETIRVANLTGEIVSEIPITSLLDASGLPEVIWVTPVGWLDAQTLALEVRGNSMEKASIVSAKFDGSDIKFVASGFFLSFLYP